MMGYFPKNLLPSFGPCLNDALFWALFVVKKYPLLAPFSNKYPLQRDIFCCSEALLLMCEALLLFGWLGFLRSFGAGFGLLCFGLLCFGFPHN
jgi:hypothetical protein